MTAHVLATQASPRRQLDRYPLTLGTRAGMNRFAGGLRSGEPAAEGVGDFVLARRGPQVLPGRYQVRLTAGGHPYAQPLKAALDPRSTATRRMLSELTVKAPIRTYRSGIEVLPRCGRPRQAHSASEGVRSTALSETHRRSGMEADIVPSYGMGQGRPLRRGTVDQLDRQRPLFQNARLAHLRLVPA
jgi:hypothetical protein